MTGLERDCLALINEFRQRHNRRPLRSKRKLHRRARGWAKEMERQDRFSHDGAPHRLRGFDSWGEVVGMTQPPSAERMVEWWKGSPDHREILLGHYTLIGVGNFGRYWCADLAT